MHGEYGEKGTPMPDPHNVMAWLLCVLLVVHIIRAIRNL